MRLVMLGCGTSSGVPRIGNDWGACDPTDSRNRRRRVSVLIETEQTRILVDTGPDLREQLLDAGVDEIDAVIWTHDHADHCHGIDDLRQLFHVRGAPVIGFARSHTLAVLRQRFAYAFDGRGGYPATVDGRLLEDRSRIGDIEVAAVDQPHGSITSAGLRFESGGSSIGYATDFNVLTDEMRCLYEGVDLLVVDALRDRPHPSHPTVAQALAYVGDIQPKQAVLTHMDQSLDYRQLADRLPQSVLPGHDGLAVNL